MRLFDQSQLPKRPLMRSRSALRWRPSVFCGRGTSAPRVRSVVGNTAGDGREGIDVGSPAGLEPAPRCLEAIQRYALWCRRWEGGLTANEVVLDECAFQDYAFTVLEGAAKGTKVTLYSSR